MNNYSSIKYPGTVGYSSGSTTKMLHDEKGMHEMVVNPSPGLNASDQGFTPDAGIQDFLSRKIRLTSFTWSPTADIGNNYNPWFLYFQNQAVRDKLKNYYLIKGNLKLTFLINGAPQHYGVILASYIYLNANQNFHVTIGGDSQLVSLSQAPHVWLNASSCLSGCICIPFTGPPNFINIASPVISQFGRLYLYSPFSLKQLNAGTDQVTVTIFAELTDVKLSGATTQPVALAGFNDFDVNSYFSVVPLAGKDESNANDEYEEQPNTGVISGPASAVADFAGALTEIPVIGPFALATHMGAGAIANIAKLFGYSRPSVVSSVSPMRNFPVGDLAVTEGTDSSLKLTVTPKQELSIDSRLLGFDGFDELAISHISRKETYLTNFVWAAASTVDTTLFAIDVNPMAERRTALSLGYRIIPTALSFVSRPFEAWSGTIVYRFQAICSRMHQGRLAICYDPIGPLTGDPYNTTFNTIIDLKESQDVSVAIDWHQDWPYAAIDVANTRDFYTTTTPQNRVANQISDNGVLYVRVVNELVSPDIAADINVMVSISAGENFELVNPQGQNIDVFPFTPVAPVSGTSCEKFEKFFDIVPLAGVLDTNEETDAPENVEGVVDVTSSTLSLCHQKALMCYGERIMSVRQLLKRYCFFRKLWVGDTNGNMTLHSWVLKQMPGDGGFDPNAVDTTNAAVPYWYNNNTFINYFKRGFAGWRGGVRWKFVPDNNCESIVVQRETGWVKREEASTYRPFRSTAMPNTMTTAVAAYNGIRDAIYASAGSQMTSCRTMNTLEVEIPYTLAARYSLTHGEYLPVNTNNRANGWPGGDQFLLQIMSSVSSDVIGCDMLCAAADDFMFVGWTFAPVVYSSTTPAA